MPTFGNGRRVAIVAGVRTPFTKAGTAFKSISAIELGKLCVAGLIQRTNLSGKEVEMLVFGTVVPSVVAPNIAREVALMPLLPKGVQAFSVGRACASANQAITDAADQIALGHVDVAIAGGAESLSNVPILHSAGMAEALVLASKAKTMTGRVKALARVRPKDLIPITPAIAEPSTGESMGQSAEKMAKLNDISREDQDHLALRSHRLAAAGTGDGRLTAEIMTVYVPPKYESSVYAGADSIIFHLEVEPSPIELIRHIRGLGKKVGLAFNPDFPIARIVPYLSEIDLALCMTVFPGFGGQAFIPESLGRIRQLANLIRVHNSQCELEVDGGIGRLTIGDAARAGATVFVAGSSIFGAKWGVEKAIEELKTLAQS
ncbi:MAG: beta-ketoacyl synthase N-terminal-like domain-containing protein [Gemmatimonadaceae bacterium]